MVNRDLAELAERYFDLAMAAAPFEATALGIGGFDAEVPDLSDEAEARQLGSLAGIQRRLEEVGRASCRERV